MTIDDHNEPDEPTEEELAEMQRRRALWIAERRSNPVLDEDCPHDEHDHGICLSCGKDINDDLVGRAEAWADAREDR